MTIVIFAERKYELARFESPVVPRVGETIELYGPPAKWCRVTDVRYCVTPGMNIPGLVNLVECGVTEL